MNTQSFLQSKGIQTVFAVNPYVVAEKRETELKPEHTNRGITRTELLIELDLKEGIENNEQSKNYLYQLQLRNLERLERAGFEAYLFNHKGKCPHIRLYGFEGITKENHESYFINFVQKYCEPNPVWASYDKSFYSTFHWCPIEFQTHYKYGTIYELEKFVNVGIKNKFEPELVTDIKDNSKRKVELDYLNILQKSDADEQERVSCVMQIVNKMKLNKDETMGFIIKHNKWNNFDPIITASKIDYIWKYTEKPNPVQIARLKKEIVIPSSGKIISKFAEEVANEIKDKNEVFYRVDAKEIIEIGKIKILDAEQETYTGFLEIKPSRFITILERYILPGNLVENKRTRELEFKEKSITSELAATTLCSDILQKALPQVQRIFTIPLPIMYKGELTFPKQGYDERFGSWLPYDAPNITEPEMSLEEAKKLFKEIFEEFCFETQQDYYNAIAGLLTPYLRGLFPTFSTRTPVFFYLANRERAGKDYLAGITGIIYEGFNLEEAPICNSEKGGNNSEELRKKLLSAMIGGRKRIHFSNNKGYIDNAVFEAITTTEKYSDRLLGKNEILTFDNELDFSLSGNVGVGFTPDFANRCRFVRLFLDIENANERKFKKSNLHSFVLQNRSKIISAMYCLVRNWKNKGMPEGSLNFASFPNWAKICGGIMESAGYGNPCVIEKDIITIAGDQETTDMKLLFEKANEIYGESPIMKEAIVRLVKDLELFGYWDLDSNRSDQTKFGNLLTKYVGRILSDIKLQGTIAGARPSRQKYVFSKNFKEATLIDF